MPGLTKAQASRFTQTCDVVLCTKPKQRMAGGPWAYNANKVAIDPAEKVANRDLLAGLINGYFTIYEAELYQSRD